MCGILAGFCEYCLDPEEGYVSYCYYSDAKEVSVKRCKSAISWKILAGDYVGVIARGVRDRSLWARKAKVCDFPTSDFYLCGETSVSRPILKGIRLDEA